LGCDFCGRKAEPEGVKPMGQWLMRKDMGKDIQLWLQKCKPKLAAFRPSKMKQVMNTSKKWGIAMQHSTIQNHHAPVHKDK